MDRSQEDNGNSVTMNSDDSSGSNVPEWAPRGGFLKHDLHYIPDLFLPTNSGIKEDHGMNRFQEDIGNSEITNTDDLSSSDVPELVPRSAFQKHDLHYIPDLIFPPIPIYFFLPINQHQGMHRFQEDNGNSEMTNRDDSSSSNVPELVPRSGFQKHYLHYIPDLIFPPTPNTFRCQKHDLHYIPDCFFQPIPE